MVDEDSGRVVKAVNPDLLHSPASLTKMMTAYLVFEAIEKGRLKLDQFVIVSGNAARTAPSKLYLREGEAISVKEALLGMLVRSANDAAVVLADAVAGSEHQFAALMTQRARELGMKNTTFRNANGLPHLAQLSTARDIAILARALMQNYPQHYHFFGNRTFSYNGRVYSNTNRLLGHYPGVDGMKTGYTLRSRFNLVTTAKRNDSRMIVVVLGAHSSSERYVQTVGMLNVAWGKTQNENLPSIEDDPEDNPKIAHKLNLNPRLKAASAAQKNTTPKTRVVAQPKQQLAKAQPVAAQPKTDLQTIWGVQIGAYRSPTMARNAAQKAQARLPKEIAESGKVSVLPAVVSKQKKLFRARIVGFSKTEAEGACQALKRTKTQCVLVQAGRAAVAKTNRSHDG